jgi:hypothetical protein
VFSPKVNRVKKVSKHTSLAYIHTHPSPRPALDTTTI